MQARVAKTRNALGQTSGSDVTPLPLNCLIRRNFYLRHVSRAASTRRTLDKWAL